MDKVIKTIDTQNADGWIIASTPAVDRQNDRVMPLGIDLTNYQKNPVVVFGHDYSSPWAIIGTAVDMSVDMSGLRIKPELRAAANDSDPMNIIKALWDAGLLRAASIGFMPIEAKQNEFGGLDFTKTQLLEVSLVGIPANQEALRLAIKALDVPVLDAPTEAITDATEPAATNATNELTPEQLAALAAQLSALTETLSSYLTGGNHA
jgi:HK97 family phage prohead protease